MARPELGIKRQCMNCGAKFYDLARDPATCPKCSTVFQMASGGRTAAPIVSRKDDDEDEDEGRPEVVSLDEAEASEDSDVKVDGDDGDDDSTPSSGDDDTFLEEEDDDDVSDLVENDDDNDDDS